MDTLRPRSYFENPPLPTITLVPILHPSELAKKCPNVLDEAGEEKLPICLVLEDRRHDGGGSSTASCSSVRTDDGGGSTTGSCSSFKADDGGGSTTDPCLSLRTVFRSSPSSSIAAAADAIPRTQHERASLECSAGYTENVPYNYMDSNLDEPSEQEGEDNIEEDEKSPCGADASSENDIPNESFANPSPEVLSQSVPLVSPVIPNKRPTRNRRLPAKYRESPDPKPTDKTSKTPRNETYALALNTLQESTMANLENQNHPPSSGTVSFVTTPVLHHDLPHEPDPYIQVSQVFVDGIDKLEI